MSTASVSRETESGGVAVLRDEAQLLRVAGFGEDRPRLEAAALAEGIVLAGVHAWGDCALDRVTCWPLIPIAGRPLVGHALSWFRRGGVRFASICANSDTVPVCRALRDGNANDLSLEYYEDVMPRGPAGCVRDVIFDREASLFVVVDGSILPRVDLSHLLAAHTRSGAVLTVVASGSASESAGAGLSPVGIYVFSREAAEAVKSLGYQDIKETLIPEMHQRGLPVLTYLVEGQSLPRVRCAASYLTVNKWATESIARDKDLPGVYRLVDEARVHQSAVLDPAARLIGPVLLDADCVVEAGAVIVGPTTIGKGCVVGTGAVVSRSAVWTRCRVGTGAVVDDCVLADGAVVRDGAVLRNTVEVPVHARR
jgi:NDP-sugar pyrophosphorylase family protein